jgi:anti-sigma factor RsiW
MTERPQTTPEISDEELSTYIDGELSAVRMSDITSLAQYDRALAQKIAALRDDKMRLSEIYGPLIARPVPAAWLHTIEQAQRQSRREPLPRRVFAMAASIALILFGLLTYGLVSRSHGDTTIADALTARHESQVMTAAANTTITPETADRTVQALLGESVKAPDLTKLGYRLAAAHTVTNGKAVAIDYADAQNRVVTLYLRHSPGTERFDMTKRGTTRICVWQDEVLSAVVLGDMSAGEMLRLATLAYTGLTAA